MSTVKTNAEKKFAALVEQIESQFLTGQWVMPFKAARPNHNVLSGKRYNGINAWVLALVALSNGYTSKGWMTYKQAMERGWHAKKGESGTPIQYWNTIQDRNDPEKEFWYVKYYTVFNLDQIVDENDEPVAAKLEDNSFIGHEPSITEQHKMLEVITDGMGVTVHRKEGLGNAFYRRREHAIYIPTEREFRSQESYLAVWLHELAHSTHRYVRPDWEKGVFGSVLYAKEECVAELTAVFSSSMLGIEKIALESHSGYISSWLKIAKEDDPNFFVKAVREAVKASFYMWDVLYPEPDHVEPDETNETDESVV